MFQGVEKKESPFLGNNLNILFIYAKNKEASIKRFTPLVEKQKIKKPEEGSVTSFL